MAIELKDKPNTQPATGAGSDPNYPYGNIKDDTGSNDGTPVDKTVYADFHQFFARMLALGGITANGLPDNLADGFQYMEAFLALTDRYSCESTTSVNLGTTSVQTFVSFTVPANMDYSNSVPVRIVDASNTNNYILGIVATYSGTTLQVLVDRVVGTGTIANWVVSIGYRNNVRTISNTGLITKVVEIGDWDMDTNTVLLVNHGIADYKKIRSISVMIRDDDDVTYSFLDRFNTGDLLQDGACNGAGTTQLSLYRRPSGFYDSVDYNATGYNRGWITIQYEE